MQGLSRLVLLGIQMKLWFDQMDDLLTIYILAKSHLLLSSWFLQVNKDPNFKSVPISKSTVFKGTEYVLASIPFFC